MKTKDFKKVFINISQYLSEEFGINNLAEEFSKKVMRLRF